MNDFNISGLHGATGDFTLDFTLSGGEGISHIAYTGGGLTGLDYRFSSSSGPSGGGTETGSLSLTFAPTAAAASANNPGGGQTLFGLSIFTSSNTSTEPYFSSAVFGTDMYWGDIALQQTGGDYGNTLDIPGANFNGQNGSTVNFDFYIAQDVLLANLGTNADPISSVDDARFQFNKADSADSFADGPDSVTFFENGNPVDIVPGFSGSLTPQVSTFNFGADTGGTDNYVLFEVSNDQWSDANVILGSVPEPRASGLLAGAIAFVWVAGRRSRKG